MSDLTKLKNIGEVSAGWLEELGITSAKDIEEFGIYNIFDELQQRGYGVTVILIYALQGALMDIHWNELPKEVKKEIDREMRTLGIISK
ncbi:TfoX/Sxy family DNA transformation protein [Candidatus Dojkabacteria bacterium]|uniref:TfoX/Sxy family DNA transformation protein n=1 Tax=Candidatus Dojkabacteria bacterium TaxID=2099670 RepID=A0A955L9G1_9BACT|nr:TfoX/Sxy family DNA transformation protein [Candidatus Dojkabacteria bacterium]